MQNPLSGCSCRSPAAGLMYLSDVKSCFSFSFFFLIVPTDGSQTKPNPNRQGEPI